MPLKLLLHLIDLIIEVCHFLTLSQVCKGAQDIGTWQKILEMTGLIAVATNCMLIGFAYQALTSVIAKHYDTNVSMIVFVVVVILEV